MRTRVRGRDLLVSVLLIPLLGPGGCDPAGPGPQMARSCAEPGPQHSGTVTGRWSAHDGPHHITSSVTVSGTLIIDAGARVCAAEGAAVDLGEGGLVRGEGNAEAPIVFTAEDSLKPWGGFRGGYPLVEGGVRLRHASILHAERGVVAEHVDLSDVLIRRIQGDAVYLSSDGQIDAESVLRRVTIEDACLSEGGAAVYQSDRSALELDDVVIRDPGCRGIFAQEYPLTLYNVRIEGAAGIGFEQYWSGRGGPNLVAVEGLRITGGADLPLSVRGEAAERILAAVPVDSLTGNAVDRIRIFHQVPRGIPVTPALGWELGRSPNVDAILLHELVLQPGSHVRVNQVVSYHGFRLRAVGTAAAPIRIDAAPDEWRALHLPGGAADTSRLTAVRLEGIHLRPLEQHTLVASDIASTRGRIWLDAPGSILRNTTIGAASSYRVDPSFAALFVSAPDVSLEGVTIEGSAGHGLLITASDATVDGCDITSSEGDAVWVANAATGIQVHGCNLVDNEGLGLRNTVDALVDAEGNWWGDPAGPLGAAGAGVSGNVDFDPWLTEPANVGSESTAGTPEG